MSIVPRHRVSAATWKQWRAAPSCGFNFNPARIALMVERHNGTLRGLQIGKPDNLRVQPRRRLESTRLQPCKRPFSWSVHSTTGVLRIADLVFS